MPADGYGVRVLHVDADNRRVRLRVLMIDYDLAARRHAPEPSDPSLFFQLLWEAAGDRHFREHVPLPLYDLTPLKDAYDFAWIGANTRRYIAGVDRIACRNHPIGEEDWQRLRSHHPYQGDGWLDEDRLPQFDVDVWVTDRQWLSHLRPGQTWSSVAWPVHADTWRDEEADRLPGLNRPVMSASPFLTVTDVPAGLAFSDDSRYLAVATVGGRIAVYDTVDWSRRVCEYSRDWDMPGLMWVPGSHVVVLKEHDRSGRVPQWSYDVDRRCTVSVARQSGRARSRDGGYRVSGCVHGHLDVSGPDGTHHVVDIGADQAVQSHDFSADGRTLFVGTQDKVHVIDSGTGTVRSVLPHPQKRVFGVAGDPDGSYLAVTGMSRKRDYLSRNGHEVTVWRTSDGELIMGRHLNVYVDGLTWSADGRWLAAATVSIGAESGDLGLSVFGVGPVAGSGVREHSPA